MTLFKTVAIAACISFSSIANAEHHVYLQNDTDVHMTGRAGKSFCSSTFTSAGIISPAQTYEVPSFVLSLYCKHGCDVFVYASKNCSGKVIATVHLNEDRLADSINNQDPNYQISSEGEKITAKKVGTLRSLFNSLFG